MGVINTSVQVRQKSANGVLLQLCRYNESNQNVMTCLFILFFILMNMTSVHLLDTVRNSLQEVSVTNLLLTFELLGWDNVYKKLKLVSNLSTTNMHLFNANGAIEKFGSAEDILTYYFPIRLEFYERRRTHMIKDIDEEIAETKPKIRYIRDVVDGHIIFIGKRKADVESQLQAREYPRIGSNYDYLLKMSQLSLTVEKIEKLEQKYEKLQRDRDILVQTTPRAMWKADLNSLNF